MGSNILTSYIVKNVKHENHYINQFHRNPTYNKNKDGGLSVDNNIFARPLVRWWLLLPATAQAKLASQYNIKACVNPLTVCVVPGLMEYGRTDQENSTVRHHV